MRNAFRIQGRLGNILKWQYLASAAQGLLGALYMLLLARTLGVTKFGIFSLVTALITTSSLFCEARMQEVVVKKFHVLDSDNKIQKIDPDLRVRLYDYMAFETLTRISPMLVLGLATPFVLAWYGNANIQALLIYMSCLGFILSKSSNGCAIGLLRVMDHTNFIALGTTVDWALRLLLSAALALLGLLDVMTALIVSFLAPTVVNIWYNLNSLRIFGIRTAGLQLDSWSKTGFLSRMRKDLRLISAQMGLSASDVMAKDLDLLILSLYTTVESIGLYRAAKFLVQILWRAVDPFYLALLPEVQRLWSAGKFSELRDMLQRTTLQLFGASALLIVGLWAGLAMFSQVFFGEGYEGLPSLAPQMSLWLLVCAPLIWGGTLAFAIGRPEITLVGSLIGTTVGIAMFFVLVPLFGLVGAAVAWSSTLAIGFAFTTTVSVYLARKKISELKEAGSELSR